MMPASVACSDSVGDVIAFAPSATPAFPQGDPRTLTVNGKELPLFATIGARAGIGSCTSLSCLVLPAGLTASGLPVGLEFDAPADADRRLLAIGLALERALAADLSPKAYFA